MVVILVHWLIRHDSETEFEQRWHEMTVDKDSGLYREILTTIDNSTQDPKFHTFSVGDPYYTTYINVGIWKSVEDFDQAIGKYIPQAEFVFDDHGRRKYTIVLDAFEFKMRERVVLRVVADRGGQLPAAAMTE